MTAFKPEIHCNVLRRLVSGMALFLVYFGVQPSLSSGAGRPTPSLLSGLVEYKMGASLRTFNTAPWTRHEGGVFHHMYKLDTVPQPLKSAQLRDAIVVFNDDEANLPLVGIEASIQAHTYDAVLAELTTTLGKPKAQKKQAFDDRTWSRSGVSLILRRLDAKNVVIIWL